MQFVEICLSQIVIHTHRGMVPRGERGKERKRRPYFVDETQRGGCPAKEGRGAGVALRSSIGGEE